VDDDRAGPWGCGCALLPGLALGMVLFAAAALVLGPAEAPGALAAPQDGSSMTVALSEEYLSRLVVAALGGGPFEGVEVDAQPGNLLAVRGQVVVKALGRTLGMPVSFEVKVAVRDGTLSLALSDKSLPSGMDASQTASLSPMLVRMAVNLQREMERALGGGWTMSGIATDEESVIVTLSRPGGSS